MYNELTPRLDEIDSMKDPKLMPFLLEKAGELGLLGLSVPEDLGGMGVDFKSSMLATEALGAGHSFSVAYARYEDFNKLEIAKEQIEKTLDDLKAAQTQLIHSEKMASLGELTAGIAHEIQNPLNFVNNFSEVIHY